MSLVALRLRKLPMVVWFDEPTLLDLQPEQRVVVQSQAAREVATVLRMAPSQGRIPTPSPFVTRILRRLEPTDREQLRDLEREEREAFLSCRQKIEAQRLSMKLLKAEYTFDRTRLIFYYKAEGKVDFRELLKTLSTQFKARIELKQIGVRDETRLLGGIGCCGKMVCCRQFLIEFGASTTRMAKDQNLSLNPQKLSGICGRLLCCLAYEHAFYASFGGKFPKLGAEIRIGPDSARVMDINYLNEKITVSYFDRRKGAFSLSLVAGRKCPVTGRNLWWIRDAENPAWEPDFPLPPQPKKKEKKPRDGGMRPPGTSDTAGPDRDNSGPTPAGTSPLAPDGGVSSDGNAPLADTQPGSGAGMAPPPAGPAPAGDARPRRSGRPDDRPRREGGNRPGPGGGPGQAPPDAGRGPQRERGRDRPRDRRDRRDGRPATPTPTPTPSSPPTAPTTAPTPTPGPGQGQGSGPQPATPPAPTPVTNPGMAPASALAPAPAPTPTPTPPPAPTPAPAPVLSRADPEPQRPDPSNA